MRKAYKPVLALGNENIRTSVDQTVDEFAATMGYGGRRYASREEFLNAHANDWEMEIHSALKELLEPRRTVLGVGSGEGEHEVRFFIEGYPVTASDVVVDAFAQTVRLFPGFKAIPFDIFKPSSLEPADDLLITGLDFYFDQAGAQRIFEQARLLLKPNGRLIFVLRYRDNLFTWLIDLIGIPLYHGLIKNLIRRLRGGKGQYLLKFHGYRRSNREIVALAKQAGFQPGRIRYAGYGAEWMRLDMHLIFPAMYQWFRRLDQRLCFMNNATIFEFLT